MRAVLRQETVDTGTPLAQADTLESTIGDTASFELPVAVIFEKVQLEDGTLRVSDDITISNVRLHASGTLSGYEAAVRATITAANGIQAQLESSGRGTQLGFSAEELLANLLGGEVRGGGTFTWLPQIEWQAAFHADNLAPSQLAPTPEDWPGRISLNAAIEGSLANGRLEMTVNVA